MQGSFLLTTRKKSKTPQQNVSGSDGHIRVITYTIAIILKSLRKQNISALAICFKKFSFKRKEKLKVRCQSLTVLCQKRRVCYNHCYDCVFFFFQKPTPNLLGTVSQKQIGMSIFKMEV